MALLLDEIHLYPKDNARAHNADLLEMVNQEPARAVLRRGQPFFIALRFNRDVGKEEEARLALVFTLGPQPHPMRDTLGRVRLPGPQELHGDPFKWQGRLTASHGRTLTLEICSPIDAPVGEWNLTVEILPEFPDQEGGLHQHPEPVYILFNPWNKDDAVFMDEVSLLDEYVLNDVGKVWVGPVGSSRGREWVFGQLDAIVLPAAMMVLDRTGLPHQDRGDPVRLSRALTKLVNSNDDNGVLVGRWDGHYDDGVAPSAWTGSVPILEQYLSTGNPVAYGQCWVFASVLTTLCRALGIPARVVSNMVSAHDANASLSVDRYYSTERGELPWDPLNPTGNKDSVWNYHVWTDVWMARPDLPKGYGGWQACDATPQETSDSFYQCGPASLEAIRRGQVGMKYDVPFMLASVNADIIRWREDPASDVGFSRIDTNQYHIGRLILTKQPWIFDPHGDEDREDITHQYKAPEGTHDERLSLLNAVRGSARAKRFFDVPHSVNEDITFHLVELDKIRIGETFNVVVQIQNLSSEPRRVHAAVSTAAVFYTGVKAGVVKKASGTFDIHPNATELLTLTVTAEEYVEKLVEYCNMKIFTLATVEDTKQTWAAEDDFQVIVPSLEITVGEGEGEGQPTQGRPCSVVFGFRNPLQSALTECSLRSEGPGLARGSALTFRDVHPGEQVRIEQRIIPQRSGPLKLVATFHSKQLVDVTGAITIDVS